MRNVQPEKKVICQKSKWHDWGLNETFAYRPLILLFVRRDFALQYKQTILGPLWLLAGPLITSLTYTFVFGQFAGMSTDGVPHLLFYLTGVNLWTMFSTCVTNVSNTFLANSPIFGKVYFPRLTVPFSLALTSFVNFLLQFAIILLFYGYFYFTGQVGGVGLPTFLAPVLAVHCGLLALGIGLVITSLTTKYRDLIIAVNYFMMLWMFASPVVYPYSATAGYMRLVLLLNPMTAIINNYRWAFIGSGTFLGGAWFLSAVITAAVLILGLTLYGKMQRNFIDTI